MKFMDRRNFTGTCLIIFLFTACKQDSYLSVSIPEIIPQPVEINQLSGVFLLNEKTKIICSEALHSKADYLAGLLKSIIGLEPEIYESGRNRNIIELTVDTSLNSLNQEGYNLDIQSKRILITAPSEAGLFYGLQSFRQLLLTGSKIENSMAIKGISIRDEPHFKWRGLMLDCSRTFWSKEYIKKTIRRLALYKMNILHLHLTDDQGWRIEIEKYPELTRKGARFPDKWEEPEERQGFYSKDDILEIVELAKDHHISIIPEIEMPGHTLSVLTCYPELSCTDGPFEIHPYLKGPGIHKDIFCAGNEKTFEFLENVLTEIFELFPSEYIHIGGDEAPKARWETCKKCQNRIKEEKLADEQELQSWFIKRIERFANGYGKKIIGWDEIMEGGLSKTATVMYWRGWKKDVPDKIIANNNNIIMSPTSHCYFDYSYEAISTMKAYEYDPAPKGKYPGKMKNIFGVQANFWSHIDRNEQGVDRQLFPRLLSISEIAWTPKEKQDSLFFKRKINKHLSILDTLNVKYHPDTSILIKQNASGSY